MYRSKREFTRRESSRTRHTAGVSRLTTVSHEVTDLSKVKKHRPHLLTISMLSRCLLGSGVCGGGFWITDNLAHLGVFLTAGVQRALSPRLGDKQCLYVKGSARSQGADPPLFAAPRSLTKSEHVNEFQSMPQIAIIAIITINTNAVNYIAFFDLDCFVTLAATIQFDRSIEPTD